MNDLKPIKKILYLLALGFCGSAFALPLDGVMARLGESPSPYAANPLEVDPFGVFSPKSNDLSPSTRFEEKLSEEEWQPSSGLSFEEFEQKQAEQNSKNCSTKNCRSQRCNMNVPSGSSGIRV
jgi:hypothetical protein